jgi:hypothetical protein
MTPLRQRMIQDLQLRGYSDRTVEAYVRSVAQLAQFYHASPDQLSEEQLRDYLVRLTTVQKVARGTHTIALCGIKFFYKETLGREWTVLDVARPPAPAPSASRLTAPQENSRALTGPRSIETPRQSGRGSPARLTGGLSSTPDCAAASRGTNLYFVRRPSIRTCDQRRPSTWQGSADLTAIPLDNTLCATCEVHAIGAGGRSALAVSESTEEASR